MAEKGWHTPPTTKCRELGIRPESLPPVEDVKRVERRLQPEDK
jgi:hypothetical protein